MAPNLYDVQWLVVGTIATLVAAWMAYGPIRLPLLALGTYLVLRAVWAGFHVPSAPVSVVVLRQTGFLAALFFAARHVHHRVPDLLGWAVPLAAASTLWGYGPLYHNTSMNAALLVCALPFACHPLTVVAVGAAVAFRQTGATGFLLLPLWVGLQRTFWGWWLWPAGIVLAGKLWVDRHMFHEGVRVKFWLASWAWFQEHVNQWVGAGLGSFLLYGPKIQEQFPETAVIRNGVPEKWRSLHCDPGQLLFEAGWIGLALGAWVYFDAVWRADHATRVALILAGVTGLVHFPMQAPLFAFFCVWLVVRAQEA